MRLDCGNCGSAAVVRNDPKGLGHIAMCDVCGWTAPKISAEFDRTQREERKRREELEKERQHPKQLEETAGSSRRRAD